jgi:predicted polyphosphate/ATP-dependent NAD kinase
MYSGVFAITPAAAAAVLISDNAACREAEVMDVDEEAYRNGTLHTRLYGYARVPFVPSMVQLHKEVYESADEDRAKSEIAEFIAEVMVPGMLYILGAGTTTEAIAERLGIEKTLLGVDAVVDGNLIAADLNEEGLLDLLGRYDAVRFIVSPIGAQGFLFGRGNQQISARVIRTAGIDRITIVATPQKMRATPLLHVDTGDAALDAEFGRSIQVVTGYRIAERKPIGGPRG